MTDSASGPAIGGAAVAPGLSAVQQLLARAVGELGAAGGAAWRDAGSGSVTLLAQCGLGKERIDLIHESWTGHRQLLQRVLATAEPQLVQAGIASRAGDGVDLNGPQRPVTLLLAPVADVPSGPRQVIELFLAADVPPAAARERFQSLQQLCRGTSPQSAAEAALDASEFAEVCRRIHSPSAVGPTAEAIADALREWCRSDRVSVLERRGRRCRLLAVSDLKQFEPRAEAVRTVERLAADMATGENAHWHAPQSREATPPDSNADHVAPSLLPEWPTAVVPLVCPSGRGACGVLILERFDSSSNWDAESRRRVELAAPQAAAALAHAVALRDLPLSSLGRGLRRLGWRSPGVLPRRAIAVAAMGIAAVALSVVRIDFEIKGRGALQPAQQRDVFAGADGIVDQIHVRHGDLVASGESLIDLRSPDLERERRRLEGELRTTRQQIADLAALRVGGEGVGRRDDGTADQLAARQQELEASAGNLDDQLQALARHEQELHLTSALAGRVLTWDVDELLAGRPVRAGQRLLTVADLAGPWVVEIDVSDRDLAHVLGAQRGDEPLRVTYVTATDVDARHEAVVTEVSQIVEHDAREGALVRVTAALERTEGVELHPGATVYARIHCGRRPAGYVWFRRLYESAAAWWAL